MHTLIIKLNKKTVFSFFFSVTVLLVVGVLAIAYGEKNSLPTAAQFPVSGEADRVEFLKQYGWQVKEEMVEQVQVTLPEVLDETLQNYNQIQVEQGFNLEKYCGKTLVRYTYAVLNYPAGDTDVVANLYQYENTIVAGDICSTKLGGFLQGLAFPVTQSD